ncbi:hypothetical protein J5J10_18080 [Ciceribacter sp. L1K23]|uniref:hypothetical protein n=1 Tax=unclassified Ciceribacter TaxID=2628820 RepID=UPI001ABE1AB5|nr:MULTISPECIES: hypothetical protein [unclassified Ciceribacter]MBO3758579.1 hypothetical protein [Ciceribacter sp. L1K22]MBR0557598.1 hypothetical protein [Ciceribacter sp. L1K23]
MPIDPELFREQQETAIARILAENRADELTDMLVESLFETLRLLDEDLCGDTVH